MGPMHRRAPRADIDEADLEVGHGKDAAAGTTGVAVALKRAVEQMGITRSARTLARLNQVDGFDCQGCAWPDPDPEHRHTAEFCENGAKAVAEEATRRLLDRGVLRPALARPTSRRAASSGSASRAGSPSRWCAERARATTSRSPGTTPSGSSLDTSRASSDPDQAIFYTSGKTSNEAAFLYQLFVRAFGTNNLPDCSNMCHESTSVALAETIGIGKGSVSLEDVHQAQLILVIGQNPGTNHPRMLSALETAKDNGARIIAINPLREAGLVRFKNPQTPRGVVGRRHRPRRPAPAGARQR